MKIPLMITQTTVQPPKRSPWEYEEPTCAEVGPIPYYLDDDEVTGREISHYDAHHFEAVKLCQRCPHISECLSWGTYHERYGIWGGTTPSQRKSLRRANGITLDNPAYAA